MRLEATIFNYCNAEYQNDLYYSLTLKCIHLLAQNRRLTNLLNGLILHIIQKTHLLF